MKHLALGPNYSARALGAGWIRIGSGAAPLAQGGRLKRSALPLVRGVYGRVKR